MKTTIILAIIAVLLCNHPTVDRLAVDKPQEAFNPDGSLVNPKRQAAVEALRTEAEG